ncbi:MAG: sulfoxide reductase heme-binding subunit YedZ [Alphaproteobacteria bacterium]|nr:sulfoxide reductase heme-binding subunit YedZ [Alphaproteobacteria bacterium]MBV9585623.1 sulfoxide reductase heme-binding subunit YedZ [Alphaproteobacteria bacterium]MBV9965010.1 sulfoxide reductase heme-binding subunit YedZ [Alphaproteobacteria bacterium]
MYPWQDYSRRLSPLKLTVFIALFLPGLWTAFAFGMGWLQPRPFTEAIHQVGLWMLRFLFSALAITPLRQIVQWPRLILVRRMIGVAAFTYGLAHITLYVADVKFDVAKAATEIVLRIYLTIGFVALLGLAALAATSTDAMVRRLGARRWQRLHRLVYAIALLAVIHYCMQSKLDLWEPTIIAGIYAWLMGYRLLVKLVGIRGKLPLAWVAALSLVAPVLTAIGEAVYFRIALGVDPARVVAANWSLVAGLRPAAVVLGLGLGVTAIGAARALGPLIVKRLPRFA